MKTTAQTIIFAINSAIRLGRNTRQAYAKSLKSRAITLPLPKFITVDRGRDRAMVKAFFSDGDAQIGGARFVDEIEHLAGLHARELDTGSSDPLIGDDLEAYFDYYERFRDLVEARAAGALPVDQVSPEEMAALLKIRQWERGLEPGTSPLQTVAGTLVELGIDYFHQVPGALNRQSSLGRVMSHFLAAVDQLEFADRDRMARQMGRLGPILFVAVAESVATLGEKHAADPKIQAFIGVAARGIAADLRDRLEGLSPAKEDRALEWGEIILRSAVANAGHYVFARPDRLFTDLNAGATELIGRVGGTLLETVIADPDGIDLAAGLNRDNLDRMLQAAFRVFAEHPQLINGNEGFADIVSGISKALAGASFQQPGYLAEITSLVLEHTADHLPDIWRIQTHGFENLLQVAAQETLYALRADDSGNWRPRLTGDQLLGLVNRMIELTAANPDWVTTGISETSLLRRLILVVIDTLAEAPAEYRLGGDAFLLVLDEAIRATAAHPGLLDRVNLLDDADESLIVQRSLQLVVAATLKRADTDPLLRREQFRALLVFVLHAVVNRHPDRRGIRIVEFVVAAAFDPARPTVPGERELQDWVDLALDVLAAYPDLITRDEALSAVVSQLANRLQGSDFNDPHWLGILVRASLKATADHAGLIVRAEGEGPRYLAATALAELLLAAHGENAHGPWRPQLTGDRLVATGEILLERLLREPDWLLALEKEDRIWGSVLRSVLDSLAKLPVMARVSPAVLEMVLWNALRAGLRSPELLVAVKWTDDDHEKVLLSRMVDLAVSFVRPEQILPGERWVILDEVLRFTSDFMIVRYPDRRGLLLLDLTLAAFEPRFDRPFDRTEAERLATAFLEVLAAHPDLLARPERLQRMVGDLAAALTAVSIPLERLLPEVLRLTLRVAGDHLRQVLEPEPGSPKVLLVTALEQSLEVLTRPAEDPDAGWEPSFSEAEILGVLEVVLAEAVAHPNWMRHAFIRITLAAMLDGIRAARLDRPLPFSTVALLIREGMRAVRLRQQLVIKFVGEDGENRQLVLTFALHELLVTIYGPDTSPAASWTLQQQALFEAISVAYLSRLAAGPAEEGLVRQLIMAIGIAADDLEQNLSWTVDDLLARLAAT